MKIYLLKMLHKMNIHILTGDITTVNTEIIVNTANFRLLGGGGVDGAIHKAGGKEILQECKAIRQKIYPNGLPVGEAVITTAGNMKAKFLIHTVGPKYKTDSNQRELLESCYRKSIELAEYKKCNSIAFPSISTGIYKYPKDEAALIAYNISKSAGKSCIYLKNIVFVFFSENDSKIFKVVNKLQ